MDEIKKFLLWYVDFHGMTTDKNKLVTCMCGYFHTFTKDAEMKLRECVKMGYLKILRGGIVWNTKLFADK